MPSFAKIENNIVTEVIVAEQDVINSDLLGDSSLWVETSKSNSFRKNFAGVGYTYNTVRDAFIAPQPYFSWTLDEDTCCWEAPVAYPDDGERYTWNEATTNWVEIT